MGKNIKKILLTLTDWNRDGKIQWWEPLLSILFIAMFWMSFVGAVVFAMWMWK